MGKSPGQYWQTDWSCQTKVGGNYFNRNCYGIVGWVGSVLELPVRRREGAVVWRVAYPIQWTRLCYSKGIARKHTTVGWPSWKPFFTQIQFPRVYGDWQDSLPKRTPSWWVTLVDRQYHFGQAFPNCYLLSPVSPLSVCTLPLPCLPSSKLVTSISQGALSSLAPPLLESGCLENVSVSFSFIFQAACLGCLRNRFDFPLLQVA